MMISPKVKVKWEGIAYWWVEVDAADYLMINLHSTQNLLSSNSTAPKFLKQNLETASSTKTAMHREAFSRTPQTIHSASLPQIFSPKHHLITQICQLYRRIWTPWSVVARLSTIPFVASMRIKLSSQKRDLVRFQRYHIKFLMLQLSKTTST